MDVRYQGVGKAFSGVPALVDLDLEVPDGKFLALLGPSGCGKTTALRILAGLEEPTSGQRASSASDDVTRLQPKDRDVAMVFQSYALYPHKSVADNIAYPLRVRKVPKRRAPSSGSPRWPSCSRSTRCSTGCRAQLSGGQRQRVALARAIVREPRVVPDGRAALQPGRPAAAADADRDQAAAARARRPPRSTSPTTRSRR